MHGEEAESWAVQAEGTRVETRVETIEETGDAPEETRASGQETAGP